MWYFFAILYFVVNETLGCAKWNSFFRLSVNTLIVSWKAVQPSKVNFDLGWKPLHSQALKIQFSQTKRNLIKNVQGSGRLWFFSDLSTNFGKIMESTKPNRKLHTNVPKPILRLTRECMWKSAQIMLEKSGKFKTKHWDMIEWKSHYPSIIH